MIWQFFSPFPHALMRLVPARDRIPTNRSLDSDSSPAKHSVQKTLEKHALACELDWNKRYPIRILRPCDDGSQIVRQLRQNPDEDCRSGTGFCSNRTVPSCDSLSIGFPELSRMTRGVF
jgi:hypothetical protein